MDGAAAAPMIFTRDLQFGDRGRDVRRLQKDLLFVKTTGCASCAMSVCVKETICCWTASSRALILVPIAAHVTLRSMTDSLYLKAANAQSSSECSCIL